jgi:hypothetical protein
MLLGAELHVHINHKIILYIGYSLQHRVQWISFVDEYGPELHYVEGSANVAADRFSWLLQNDILTPSAVGKKRPADNINDKSDVDETPYNNYIS